METDMLLSRRLQIYVIAILICSISTAQAGGGKFPPGGPCGPNGVACIPPRMSYGYYPTTWRRWPTDTGAQPKKTEAEPVPTPPPAQQLPPRTEERPAAPSQEQPPSGMTPEPLPTFPIETEPGTPGEPQLPFPPATEDFPPQPPAKAEPRTEGSQPTPPTDTLPTELPPQPPADVEPTPSEIEATPQEKQPSLMPPDDPFGDEAPRANEPSEETPSKGGVLEPKETIEASPRRTFSWHAPAKAASLASTASAVGLDVPKVTARLAPPPPAELAAAGDWSPSEATAKSNPLRAATLRPREDRVVPTANWTAGAVTSPVPASPARANPLRGN
jgi:hypothetical protein